MGEHTGISWTDHTFNPWWGCTKVSPACEHCYAERDAKRYGHHVWGPSAPRRFFGDKHWQEPLRWNVQAQALGVRRRVFCASMADVCERVGDVAMADRLEVERFRLGLLVSATPWLDWLLLTKRPENALDLLPPAMFGPGAKLGPTADRDRYPDNVWWGTTAETQQYADTRLPALLAMPARVRFCSYEPALGPANFMPWLGPNGLHWLIAGGESGAGYREAELDWYRGARDQCLAAGAAFWFKQHSGLHPRQLGHLLDGREHHELPRERLAA